MTQTFPSVSVAYACNGSSTKANFLGMRSMQERVYESSVVKLSPNVGLRRTGNFGGNLGVICFVRLTQPTELFELYTQMTAKTAKPVKQAKDGKQVP
jgi:hypothetical protein